MRLFMEGMCHCRRRVLPPALYIFDVNSDAIVANSAISK